MRKIGNFIVRTVDYFFWGLMIIITISATISLAEIFSSGWIKYTIVFVTLIFLCVLLFFISKIIHKIKHLFLFVRSISSRRMMVIIFLFVAATKIFLILLLNPDATKHPDMATYQSFAFQLADNDVITEYVYSAFMWKYEVIYGLFLSPVVKLFGKDTKVMLIYLSILFALMCVFLFDILRKHIGKSKAFLGVVLFNAIPSGLFETQLLIHETPLLIFYIFSFWLLLKFLNRKFHWALRGCALLLSALLIAFGNQINQGGTVVIISYCIYLLVVLFRDNITFPKLVEVCSAVICYLLCFVIVANLCVSFINNTVKTDAETKSKIGQIQKNTLPNGWVLFLGSNLKHPGSWNEQDALTYYKYKDIENEDEAKQYQINLICDRLQAFWENPLLIPRHLFIKIQRLWGNQMLYFDYGQGNDINQFMMTWAHGLIHKLIFAFNKLVFILLYFLLVLSHKRHRPNIVESFYSPVTQFKMMIVGLTAALLLFEVMPKYASHMQIILFIIGVWSIDSFMENNQEVKKKCRVLQNI